VVQKLALAIVLLKSHEYSVGVEGVGTNLETIKRFLQECLRPCLPDIQEKVQNLLHNFGNHFQDEADIADKLADLPVVFGGGDFARTNILSEDEGHITARQELEVDDRLLHWLTCSTGL
jgi:hypothetical protein